MARTTERTIKYYVLAGDHRVLSRLVALNVVEKDFSDEGTKKAGREIKTPAGFRY
jgi:hypothetical protein